MKSYEPCVELWLVRHGETTRSVSREIAGWSDPPLTERGEAEVARLRPFLEGEHFDGVWSSDLQRAVTSARLAWGEATPDPRLRELHFGDLEERSFAEVDPELARNIINFEDFSIPGGEDRHQFEARVRSFVDELPCGRHLLFVHGGVIRILSQHLGEDRFLPTASILGLDYSGQEILFVRVPDDSRSVFQNED